MAYQVRRDFVGYGANPPDPKWPDGARLAVNFVLNYEEGSEPSVQDGEGFTETGLTESTTSQAGMNGRDLAAEGMFEYGARVGFWRLMRAFQERGLPMTVFGCALALERNPAAAAAIKASGFDVCSHGWRWIKHYELSEQEEREHIRKAIASTEKMIGERPLGWYCRYGPGENTRRLVAEEGGFLYDSDYYGDDLPFWTEVEKGDGTTAPHLVVPYSLDTNDMRFVQAQGFNTGDHFFTYLRDSFDALYAEGDPAGLDRPKMMSIGMHSRLLGKPGRIGALQRFLDHVGRHAEVWVARRIDIARHWKAVHPFVHAPAAAGGPGVA